ncbi:MAG TPA: ATP-binding protein [Chloroflexia bacterium]|nr:ATP-binding protein [Chloroflexia bacterium]
MLRLTGETIKSKNLLAQINLKYSSTSRPRWQGIVFSLSGLTLTTIIMFNFKFELYNVNMIYMALTLIATVWFGLGTGVLTAIAAFFCFDYYFIPPYFTFIIDAFQGWTAVFLFLGTALFANQVAGRARLGNQQAQARAQEASALYELATAVITKVNQTEMLLLVLQKVCEALGITDCTLFIKDEKNEDQLVETARIEPLQFQKEVAPPRHPDLALAQAVFNQHRPAFLPGQRGTLHQSSQGEQPSKESLPASFGSVAYVPISSGSQTLGVMVLVGSDDGHQLEFSPEEKRLMQVLANHVALAVEHARLIREAAQVATLRDSDKLKSSLLASVSHELRTPLAAIKTATANLQTRDIDWSDEERDEFLELIEIETDRLTRLVSNVLDLSKIEAHALKPDFGWYYLPEIVEKVVDRLKGRAVTNSHPVTTSFDRNLPLVRMDYMQIDQVLTNLLENAAKYSEAGRPIAIQVTLQEASQVKVPEDYAEVDQGHLPVLVVKVLDEGPGIPPAELERIFDKFYRVRSSQEGIVMNVPGTGIGLAIAKGIIEAHGGQIWAQNRLYGGSLFTFSLPLVPLNNQNLAESNEEETPLKEALMP